MFVEYNIFVLYAMLLIIDNRVKYSVACHCIPYNTGASADHCIPYNVAYHCIPYVTGEAIHNYIPHDILFPIQCALNMDSTYVFVHSV